MSLYATFKVYERNKSRIRLDECGTYAGLTSKIFAEYSSKYLSSGGSGSDLINRTIINEGLVTELIETFLIDEVISMSSNSTAAGANASASTANISNYDNLWHILSLLTLNPTQLINNRETLLRVRSRACDLVIKLVFAQPYSQTTTAGTAATSAIRALTKLTGWQDIVCQLFCVERIPMQPTAVSRRANKMASEDDDEWENLDYNGYNKYILMIINSLFKEMINERISKTFSIFNQLKSMFRKEAQWKNSELFD